MSEHSEVMTVMQVELEAFDQDVLVLPRALAVSTYDQIATSSGDRLVEYLTIEQLTAMARKLLSKRFDHDSDETEAHQGDLFSGSLQGRYPLPKKSGEEPVYKLRGHLTADERAWNVDQLRKSAQARLEHADALEAEGQFQEGGAA